MNVIFSNEWQNCFLKKIEEDGPWSNWQLFQLAYEIEQHLAVPDFYGIMAPKFLPHLKPYPHQIETAKTVIEKMNGRAILADEVGLGKTIEAGLIIKEYMIRGLAQKVLILVPASLVTQWVQELNEKFFIPAVAQKKAYVWEQCDVVVASLDTAKRPPHREIVLNQDYDLVIIDEAHKLKNPKTKNYEFVKNLKKKFCLLLTATPVQNKLEEIFNLVSLLKPGHLGDLNTFTQQFRQGKRAPKNDEKLRELISKVMVRNRREDTGIVWTKRFVETIPVTFSQEERLLYDTITRLKEQSLWKNNVIFLTLQRELCSSKEALFMTLKQLREENPPFPLIDELIAMINAIPTNAKALKTLEIIREINDKVIIFTEYRATQLYLQWFLKQHGISSVPFRGGFKRSKKDWMRQLFENNAQVLIATEAGGEGINLQFCSHIINYDLPWNPMRIEQRIGRIHRLGQKNDVRIYNLAIEDTIEQHILKLLYEKINMFEKVVGELDDILSSLGIDSLEPYVNDIFTNSDSEGEIKIKLDHLASIINSIQKEKEEMSNAARANP